ncbi:ABC transporter permease [Brevundimonas sp.]|uniref:ABC transporter permease n=1 Tax=Brevundimonas sp. TaxID=1871086 RepID=UPI003BA9080C
MIAIIIAYGRSFLRDRAGLAMTLILPPVVYLLFAAIFGAGARGEIESTVFLHDAARTTQSRVIEIGLKSALGDRLTLVPDAASVEAAVIDGRSDAGVLILPSQGPEPLIEVVSGAGRDVAAAGVVGRVQALTTGLRRNAPPPASTVRQRSVGPEGDVQAVYYAGAVSIMFVFFAAMHGAMAGLDERRSGLQARLSLAAGGLASIIAGRAAWLLMVGLAQSAVVFAIAAPRLPPTEIWQWAAWLATAGLASASAAGVALAIIALCRSREQAQPLSTFIVLLLAALGGSMAPRFLMPEVFRQLGWLTPHAWVIEAYQTLMWRGVFDMTVVSAWIVLAVVAVFGGMIALAVETRRPVP